MCDHVQLAATNGVEHHAGHGVGSEMATDQLDRGLGGPRLVAGAAGRLRSDSRIRVSTPIGLYHRRSRTAEIMASVSERPTTAYFEGVVDAEALAGDQAGHGGRVDDVAALPPAIIRGTKVSTPDRPAG
jgi:hypothetical protein